MKMYYRPEQEPDCISIKRAETDREVGFAFYDDIPVKTRRFVPRGFRDTVRRGWARPIRPMPTEKVKPQQGTTSPSFNLSTTGEDDFV
jgi:hypothetical protein